MTLAVGEDGSLSEGVIDISLRLWAITRISQTSRKLPDESDSALRKHSKFDDALVPNPQEFGHRRDAGDNLCQLLGRGPSCRHNVLLSLPGREYIAYFPRGGTNDVKMIAGSYEAEWLHPETGRYYPKGTLELKDGSQEFVPRDQPNHDWVLHLRKRSQTNR